MAGWLILIGIVGGIWLISWVAGQIQEYREQERSKQRDEIAINVLSELNISNEDKIEIEKNFRYVINNIPARFSSHQEEYELIKPPLVQRRQGMVCPKCGLGYLVRRQGQYGSFLGCTRYPACKGTKPVGWNDKKAVSDQKKQFEKEFLKDLERAFN